MAGAGHTTSALRRWTACAVFSATMLTDLPRADHRRAPGAAQPDRGTAPPAAAVSHAARSPHRERSHPIFGL
jgi:hypothetical protein